MGAWGTGFFENDDALDWKGDLLESSTLGLIEETLSASAAEEYIEADLASQALAAAEIVAALNGRPGMEIRNEAGEVEDLVEWLKAQREQAPHLRQLALTAVEKIKTESELQELWAETDDYELWIELLNDLQNRIKELK
ncbi:DUF4259 domain-containing protein [Brevibacillus sp. SYSU BS000544]|uniref:DUF4259 domain-containing protein n=1 Tax=Brevibacillus sp. SYSU BS000544 TaxID=3416443 RepID=UPI003CE4A185